MRKFYCEAEEAGALQKERERERKAILVYGNPVLALFECGSAVDGWECG